MLANIILAITTILIFLLGLLVYLNNSKQKANQTLFYFTLSVAFWTSTNLFTNLSQGPEFALFWSRATIVGAALLVYFFLIFSFYFPVEKRLSLIFRLLLFVPALGIILLSPTNFNISSATAHGSQVSTGVLYIVFAIYLPAYLIWSLVNFIRVLRSSKGQNREQLMYIFVAIAVSFIPGFILNGLFPIIGYPEASSFGPVFVILFVATIAYAMLQHKLLDIRLVVARSATYVLTIGIISVLYGFIAFRFAGIFIGNLSPQIQQTFYVILTVIFAFTFAPLRRFFERISNRIFYRDRYDSQQLVNEVGRILASEIELDKVSHKVLHEITKQIKIDKGEIIVFGENQMFYENNVFKNGGGQISPDDLSKLGRIMLVADDLQGGDRKELMQRYGISMSLALRTSEKFIGYMLLGEKKSGDIYNDQDLRVLKIIANEVSVAMANALSYKEIQLFSETLAEKVRQRTGQLRHANDQLKELDKAKDEFISMASHQLRTPLTTVKGYASMLEEGDFGKLTKEQMKIVEQTLDGSNRMARLIDDLLNVSRMDANRFFLEADKVDIIKLVSEELTQLKTLADSKKIELTYTPPKGKIPIILLDENKTRQVVMNITDNAIHYSAPPAGGGHVHVSMTLKGNFVEFLVADDGIGVPAEAQDKLFTKMFRASNAQGVRPDGTGLGLYLVKRVVEEQGGEIIFSSEPGKGSTFGFRLPLSGIPKETLEESKKIGAKVAASHK